MYLKISNIGEVSRKYFELIGATDKRNRMNDFSVIGNKGSGAKLAIIPTLRLGLEVIISSKDSHGTYVLRYKTQEIDLGKGRTARQIIFSYDGEADFPSQLTLDAFQDWDKPVGEDDKRIFKALREYVCNAWDEDKSFSIERAVEVVPAPEGKTVVYLSLSQEIEEILQNIPRYFKILGKEKPFYSSEATGAIFPKSEPERTRLFSQGVLVDCKGRGDTSLFDYSLFSKYLLSEERIIKDFSRYEGDLGYLIISVVDADLAFKILDGWIEGVARLEARALVRTAKYVLQYRNARASFKKAWEKRFGHRAVLGVGITQVDEDAKFKGYTVIKNLDYELRHLLIDCGVTQASDIVPIRRQEEKKWYERIEPNAEQQARFKKAYEIFRRHVPQVGNYPVFFFRVLDQYFDDTLGFAGDGERKYQEIWLNEKLLSFSPREILKTLEHEERHCETGFGDYDRRFDKLASERYADLMLADPNPERGGSYSGIVSPRGIQLPQKLVGKSVHISVEGEEVRIRTKEETSQIFTATVEPIKGHFSQVRQVSGFKDSGWVYIPGSVCKQLPSRIEFRVSSSK